MKHSLYIRVVAFMMILFVAAGLVSTVGMSDVAADELTTVDLDEINQDIDDVNNEIKKISLKDSTSASEATISTQKKTTGKQVVNYAKKFVGNPYKYGGTSLTKGADCSGFVMSVYKHFGYKLPHSSSEIATKGKKVSWSKKKPGDVICYYGHVAIYIGNNKIVHASNKKSGIKISNKANYRKVRCVRRIIK
ncbi:MAG: C40 family peptidase [Lachnospiraceae bacterium]|nr:C40 family peptidase [Lachnospiraceae bacterium]